MEWFEGNEYDNEYDNDNEDDNKDDNEDDNEDDEYDSDINRYTKNDAIVNRIFETTAYIEITTVHTTNNTEMNTITEIPTLTPTTNTIIELSSYGKINMIEDVNDPNNSIKGTNVAKKKKKYYDKRK